MTGRRHPGWWIVPLLLLPGACAARFEVSGERAYARVVHQVELGPRVPGMPGHAATLEWLTRELTRLKARVERQDIIDTTLGRTLELHNVIAHFGPATERTLLLCAHWDSRPWCDQDPDAAYRERPVPGANDGGSGVAVLLEVAELMSRDPPRVAVDLVFFDGEDQGEASRPEQFCLGSRGYASRLASSPERSSKRMTAFLFDMVGDRELDIYPEIQSAERASNLVALVLAAARATGARHFHDRPRYSLVDDHTSLLESGVPAVDIIDFDYPAWHTHRDLPDQVSAESLGEVARVAAWIVYRSSLARP